MMTTKNRPEELRIVSPGEFLCLPGGTGIVRMVPSSNNTKAGGISCDPYLRIHGNDREHDSGGAGGLEEESLSLPGRDAWPTGGTGLCACRWVSFRRRSNPESAKGCHVAISGLSRFLTFVRNDN